LFLFSYAGCGYIVAFTKNLTIYQIYHSVSHPLHHFPLAPPTSNHGIVSIGIICTFTYMCTQYLHRIHPLVPFPHLLPPPIDTNHLPSPQAHFFHPSIPRFCKRKKEWHFSLFKIATQWVSLWHFHIYMYYSPSLVISSIFLLSTLVLTYGGFNSFKNSIFILFYFLGLRLWWRDTGHNYTEIMK
jgi:hypothetical protein